MTTIVRYASVALATAVLGTMTSAQVQRRPPGAQEPTVKINAAMQVGSRRYDSAAAGRCEYAQKASIYDVPAEMYRVEQNGDGGSLMLTIWRPSDGSSAMMNLSVAAANARETVQTVKGQPSRGSGTVVVERSGEGGTLRIDAKIANGVRIAGAVTCSAFTPAIAEGGE